MNTNKKSEPCQTVASFSVYVIWCRLTNQFYVGVTGQASVHMRIRQHKKGNQYVDSEIQRLGWEGNYDWWIVEKHIPADQISECEQKWIGIFDCVYPKGYNKTRGGIKHFKHSKATCDKMGNAHRGKKRAPFTDEHRANLSKSLSGENHPNYGKPARNRGVPCPEETKEKIRKKLTGRKRPDQSERMKGENNPNFGKPMPEATKAKLREKALERDTSGENNPMYGKRHTAEAIEKIRQARLGKTPWNKGLKCPPHTAEHNAKIAAAEMGEKNHFFGKHHTEEVKEKNRQAHLGKPSARKGKHHTPEAIAKMREKALAKAAAEENLAAAYTTPTNLSNLLDAVILQQSLSSEIAFA